MTLREVINQYIVWRQTHGMKFVSNTKTLHRFW